MRGAPANAVGSAEVAAVLAAPDGVAGPFLGITPGFMSPARLTARGLPPIVPTSGFPTPATTGVPAGTSLSVWGGAATLGPGTYDAIQFNAEIDLSAGVSVASPAIFTRCYFAAGINNFATGGTTTFHRDGL
jgi:hypothetical protein